MPEISTEQKYARAFGLPEDDIAHADYNIITNILTVTYGIDQPRYKQKKVVRKATKEFADYFQAPIFIGKGVDYILTAYLKAKGGVHTVRESREISKLYYTSTDPVFGKITIKQFIETEVEERGNYTVADVQNWMKKYNLSMNDLAIWVSPKKWVANRYNLLAEEWDKAEKIPESQMSVYEIKGNEGFIIPESDDGDEGYLFIFKPQEESKLMVQPWEMTYREFADLFEDVWHGQKFTFAERVGKPLGIQSQAGEPYHMIQGRRIGYSGSLDRDRWRLAIVDKALSEGKKVPEEVLAELSESLKHEREKLGGTGMAEQSLEDMVKELQEIYKEFEGAVRGTPKYEHLLMQEHNLNEAIRDIYLKRIENIPESKQLQPEGLGVLALAGKATTKAVQESPGKVNLKEMVSEWLKGQEVTARIRAARSVEELQPIMKEISFLPLTEIEKNTLRGRYLEKYNALMSERPFGAPVKTGEEKPRVLGAPSPQEQFEAEQRKKVTSAFRGQQTLTSGASVTKRLSEFGIKEKMLPEMTSSMREYIQGAVAVKDVIHHYRDSRPPTRGVLYRARDKTYFVEAQDGQFYASMGWEDVTAQGVREPAASYAAARGYRCSG